MMQLLLVMVSKEQRRIGHDRGGRLGGGRRWRRLQNIEHSDIVVDSSLLNSNSIQLKV